MDDLAQLSAKATQGTLVHHGWGDGSTQMGMTNIFNEDAEVLVMECIPDGDAAFIVALWNAYRAGELVPATTLAAKDAEIARLAEALRDCRKAVSHNNPEPRRNVREIVDDAIEEHALAIGDAS